MKRARAMLISLGTLLAIGCGMHNYDYRIEQTLERMKYDKRLDANLAPPAAGKMQELGIYVRPPVGLSGPTQAFQFAAVEPGRFELENSFMDQGGQSLHVLARVEMPKAAAKKGEPPAPEAPPRGDFNEEVVGMIRDATGADLQLAQFKAEQKQVKSSRESNTFQTATVDREANEMKVFLYGSKSTPYKVALIFEYPKAEKNAIGPKIDLALENFHVGDSARRAFSGGQEEDMGDEGGAEEGPPI